MLGNILEDVDGITLGLDVGTRLGSLDWLFDCYNDGNLEDLLLWDSLGSTDGKLLDSDVGIILVLSAGKVIGTILGNADRITLGIDVGTELVSLDVSFDCFNVGKLVRLFIGGSLGSTDGKTITLYLDM